MLNFHRRNDNQLELSPANGGIFFIFFNPIDKIHMLQEFQHPILSECVNHVTLFKSYVMD
jgi:hypothetical protein